jgi:hypothetical protein
MPIDTTMDCGGKDTLTSRAIWGNGEMGLDKLILRDV